MIFSRVGRECALHDEVVWDIDRAPVSVHVVDAGRRLRATLLARFRRSIRPSWSVPSLGSPSVVRDAISLGIRWQLTDPAGALSPIVRVILIYFTAFTRGAARGAAGSHASITVASPPEPVASHPGHVDRELTDQAAASRAVVTRRFATQKLPLHVWRRQQPRNATAAGPMRESQLKRIKAARGTLAGTARSSCDYSAVTQHDRASPGTLEA